MNAILKLCMNRCTTAQISCMSNLYMDQIGHQYVRY
jgi:hypothetical protein